MRVLGLISALTILLVPAFALAQDRDQTLADIRQELSVLFVEIQDLKRELSTTGSPNVTIPSGMIDRVNGMESELSRLTRKTEELEFRINEIVRDGTNRIGDLEFRLVELEGGDLSQLKENTTLGGGAQPPATGGPTQTETPEPEMAMGEEADFQKGRNLLDDGDAAGAAAAFLKYTETYPAGAYTADAHFLRGEAEASQEAWSTAARAYLNSFSGDPDGARAPDALLKLGLSLEKLGQRDEACLTLQQVAVRFPGGEQAASAETARQALTCQ
jgi:tol-pal system protein YbgF